MTKYICIKQLRKDWLETINQEPYIKIGETIEVDLEENFHDGTYTIFLYRNDFKYRSSILRLDIDHFISLAEWRDKQIDSILEDV